MCTQEHCSQRRITKEQKNNTTAETTLVVPNMWKRLCTDGVKTAICSVKFILAMVSESNCICQYYNVWPGKALLMPWLKHSWKTFRARKTTDRGLFRPTWFFFFTLSVFFSMLYQIAHLAILLEHSDERVRINFNFKVLSCVQPHSHILWMDF